jgi:valyl-tRNA synthetase
VLQIRLSGGRAHESIQPYSGYLQRLAKVTSLEFMAKSQKPRLAASAVVDGEELFVPLEGVIDVELEKSRLGKEIERVTRMVKSVSAKLSNNTFLERAPEEVIERERDKLQNFTLTLEKLEKNYSLLVENNEDR